MANIYNSFRVLRKHAVGLYDELKRIEVRDHQPSFNADEFVAARALLKDHGLIADEDSFTLGELNSFMAVFAGIRAELTRKEIKEIADRADRKARALSRKESRRNPKAADGPDGITIHVPPRKTKPEMSSKERLGEMVEGDSLDGANLFLAINGVDFDEIVAGWEDNPDSFAVMQNIMVEISMVDWRAAYDLEDPPANLLPIFKAMLAQGDQRRHTLALHSLMKMGKKAREALPEIESLALAYLRCLIRSGDEANFGLFFMLYKAHEVVWMLGLSSEPSSVDVLARLIEHMESSDYFAIKEIVVIATISLGRIGGERPRAILEGLSDHPDKMLREFASLALKQAAWLTEDDALTQALKSKKRKVRYYAACLAHTLGLRPDEAGQVYIDMLKRNDRNAGVAFLALKRYPDIMDVAAPFIIECAKKWFKKYDTPTLAAEMLGEVGTEEAVDILMKKLEVELRRVRKVGRAYEDVYFLCGLVEALGTAGDERAAPLLLRLIDEKRDRPFQMRSDAVDALAKMGYSDLKEVATGLLGDDNSCVRESAVKAFASIPDDTTASELVFVLFNDPDVSVRRSAAEALGELGPAAREAVPALVKCVSDGHWGVSVNAMQALGNIGEVPNLSLAVLIPALDDPRTAVKAAIAIAKFGSLAKRALPELFERREDAQGVERSFYEQVITAVLREEIDERKVELRANSLRDIPMQEEITPEFYEYELRGRNHSFVSRKMGSKQVFQLRRRSNDPDGSYETLVELHADAMLNHHDGTSTTTDGLGAEIFIGDSLRLQGNIAFIGATAMMSHLSDIILNSESTRDRTNLYPFIRNSSRLSVYGSDIHDVRLHKASSSLEGGLAWVVPFDMADLKLSASLGPDAIYRLDSNLSFGPSFLVSADIYNW